VVRWKGAATLSSASCTSASLYRTWNERKEYTFIILIKKKNREAPALYTLHLIALFLCLWAVPFQLPAPSLLCSNTSLEGLGERPLLQSLLIF